MSDLEALTQEILAFRDEREWARFHTPGNVAAALAVEAAELQEQLLWKDAGEIAEFLASKPGHRAASDEIADVVIYAILFAHAAGIDLQAAIRVKLEKNREKYPVALARGSARKYTELGDG